MIQGAIEGGVEAVDLCEVEAGLSMLKPSFARWAGRTEILEFRSAEGQRDIVTDTTTAGTGDMFRDLVQNNFSDARNE